jgi:hypothetical protein
LETKKEPDENVDLEGDYHFGHSRVKESQVPSGRLTLAIENGRIAYGESARRRWGDSAKGRLEDRLNKFVASLIQLAAKVRECEEKETQQAALRREEEKRRVEQARILQEQQKLYKDEKVRVNALMTQAENWGKSKLLRDFIDAVKAAVVNGVQFSPDLNVAEWIAWAEKQADRLDPLTPSPPSILDHKELEQKEPERAYPRW